MIRRSALFLALLASPAVAQDADPTGQAVEAYVACFMTHATKDTITASLTQFGWTLQPGEDGITDALPAKGEATLLHFADDASYCQVESTTIGTKDALTTLSAALEGTGTKLPAPSKDADGCAVYDFGAGVTATLTSGGNDPTCTSDTDSTVTFDFASN